jgi:hypothetical protein
MEGDGRERSESEDIDREEGEVEAEAERGGGTESSFVRRRSRRGAAAADDQVVEDGNCHEELSGQKFEIGQMIFAKTMKSKSWSMAEILTVDMRSQELEVQFLDEKTILKLPVHPECIQSLSEKRKRKFRVNFDEDERAFNEAIGSKKRSKKIQTESDAVEMLPRKVDNPNAPARVSANVKNLKLTEAATESSLKDHLPLLRPFLTPKVYEKIQNSPTVSLPRHQLTTQPKSIVKATLRDYQIAGVHFFLLSSD